MLVGQEFGSVVVLSSSRRRGMVECFCRVCKKDLVLKRSDLALGCSCQQQVSSPAPQPSPTPPDDGKGCATATHPAAGVQVGGSEGAHAAMYGPLLPEFFFDTLTWECFGKRAPTLRALLAKFPAGTEFVGYHPDGYEEKADYGTINEARDIADKHAAALARRAIEREPSGIVARTRLYRMKHDHEHVMNLYAAGYITKEITQLTGVPVQTIDYIRKKYRDALDPRADLTSHVEMRKQRGQRSEAVPASAPAPQAATA